MRVSLPSKEDPVIKPPNPAIKTVARGLSLLLLLGLYQGSASSHGCAVPEEEKLLAYDGVALDQYGHAVSLDGDVPLEAVVDLTVDWGSSVMTRPCSYTVEGGSWR